MADDDFRDVLLELERLEEGDKFVRKRALENICSIVNTMHADLPENKRKVLVSVVIGPVLGALADSTERCRELAAQLLLDISSMLPLSDDVIGKIVPTLRRRLCGADGHGETSEEVRLLEAQALTRTIMGAGAKCAKHLNDVVVTLCACLWDAFYEVRKEACRCVVQLEKAAPDHFHLQCDSMLEPLLQALRHQHSAVRTLAMQALGPILEQGDCRSLTPTIASTVAELLDDRSTAVRLAMVTAVARWLAKDFGPNVLHIMLISLTDQINSVRDKAVELWRMVGGLYVDDQGLRYAAVEADGCRLLVQRHLGHLIGVALEDLEAWRVEERRRAARLLNETFGYAGTLAAPHLGAAMPVLIAALCRDEEEVLSWVTMSLEAVSPSVSPECWLTAFGGPFSTGALHAFAALVRPCPEERLRPYAQPLFAILFQYAGAAADTRSQLEVLGSMEALLASVQDPMDLSVKELLASCLGVQAASQDDCISDKVGMLLRQLSGMLSLPSVEDMSVVYGKDMIQDLSENRPHTKTAHWDALRELVTHAGTQSGDLVPSLVALLNGVQRRPEWQPQAASVLQQALCHGRGLSPQCAHAALRALLPLLTAQGRPCLPARSAALRCLLQLLEALPSLQASAEVVGAVLSLLEDAQPQVRALACRAAAACAPEPVASRALVGRLDDVSTEVRVAAARALEVLAMEGLQEVVDALELHSADASPAVRNACSEVLGKLSGSDSQLELDEAHDTCV
ncbi:dynein axonemal assembly factor 5 [Ixodes scapularis]